MIQAAFGIHTKQIINAYYPSPSPDHEERSCEDRACDFPRKRRTESYKSRRDTGANVRGRALQQATTVTTLLKRRESSFVWYFRYIKPRICDSGAEFGLAKLHFTARGRIPGYINLPLEHREEKEITRVLAFRRSISCRTKTACLAIVSHFTGALRTPLHGVPIEFITSRMSDRRTQLHNT